MAENPIFAVAARVAALRARGADVIALTAGEPQVATDPAVVSAAIAAIADPSTHHYGTAAGDPRLRATVAERVHREHGGDWAASDVLVTSGAKHALALGLHAIVRPGDRVLIAAPGWPGHTGAVAAVGATPIPVRTDAGHRMTAASLARQTDARTRAVILSSPGNPTGAVYGLDELRQIAAWAAAAGVWIISDDVYAAFDYSGRYVPLLRAAPEARERTLIVNSVSKEHAMTGWRIGWLAAPSSALESARTQLERTVTHVPVALQLAAVEALGDSTGPVQARDTYRARRDRLVTALNRIDGIECAPPDGGMFAFPTVAGLLAKGGWARSGDLVDWLIDTVGVAVVPGEAFGAPDRVRICFAVDDDTLDAAITRLRRACNSLQAVDA